jgi:hypothetical protein
MTREKKELFILEKKFNFKNFQKANNESMFRTKFQLIDEEKRD